tara:strand:+ start:59 stop:289 length:231 start_codon:yes stop_codon:yes gene_type:complete
MNNEMQDLKFTSAGDFMKMTEESHHDYCTTKGLGKAFAVIVFMIAVVPVLLLMAMVGLEDYARYCNLTILPCFGLN